MHVSGRLRHAVGTMLSLAVLVTAGCASAPSSLFPGTERCLPQDRLEGNGWWYARFRMNWCPDTEPSWHLDAMIAHRVVCPLLKQYRSKVLLWRFHRRAAPDQAGHQFSFIFYSSPKTAIQIFRAIQSNHDLQRMKSSSLVLMDSYDDTQSIPRPNIEDTSDQAWSPAVRKSWPHFIMGVSEMWLALIGEYSARRLPDSASPSLDPLEESYREVHRLVEETWRDEGGHALLHHLNAIFGYEPVRVNRTEQMRF